MDSATLHLAIFLVGTFAAAFVAALAGFALGVVALAIWLYALTPVQAAALIAAYALLVQGYAVWKLRRSINVRRLLPFILGSAVGIPAGIAVLKWASPADLRNAVGVVLILFSIYNLARPQLPQVSERALFSTALSESLTGSSAHRRALAAPCPRSGVARAGGTRMSSAPSSSPPQSRHS